MSPTTTKQITSRSLGGKMVLNPREETMKIRLVFALVGLAISFALPTFPNKKTRSIQK